MGQVWSESVQRGHLECMQLALLSGTYLPRRHKESVDLEDDLKGAEVTRIFVSILFTYENFASDTECNTSVTSDIS